MPTRPADPLVKVFFLPACHLVGYKHRTEFCEAKTVVFDNEPYDVREIDDAEFTRLRMEWRKSPPKTA